MSFFSRPPRYKAYLLRIWEERTQDTGAPSKWRFSLEDPNTAARRGFDNLQVLLRFLETELANQPAQAQEQPNPTGDLVQRVKRGLRSLSDAELDMAAAAGDDQAKPEDLDIEDEESLK
jgi:hypothetical protein